GDTIAEAAYTHAAGRPATETAISYGRSFVWTCHACDKAISDHGPCNGPADDEQGHKDNCPRLDAAIAAWQGRMGSRAVTWPALQQRQIPMSSTRWKLK